MQAFTADLSGFALSETPLALSIEVTCSFHQPQAQLVELPKFCSLFAPGPEALHHLELEPPLSSSYLEGDVPFSL